MANDDIRHRCCCCFNDYYYYYCRIDAREKNKTFLMMMVVRWSEREQTKALKRRERHFDFCASTKRIYIGEQEAFIYTQVE